MKMSVNTWSLLKLQAFYQVISSVFGKCAFDNVGGLIFLNSGKNLNKMNYSNDRSKIACSKTRGVY